MKCPRCNGTMVAYDMVCGLCDKNGEVDPMRLMHRWETERHESAFSASTVTTVVCAHCGVNQRAGNMLELCPALVVEAMR